MSDPFKRYGLRRCGPVNRDDYPPAVPDADVAATYGNRDYPYNYEDASNGPKLTIQWADGHHARDRWDLSGENPSFDGAHEHDDYKRPPSTILDQEPENQRAGYLATTRLPDSRAVYADVAGGDELGLSAEQRARRPKNVLTDGT